MEWIGALLMVAAIMLPVGICLSLAFRGRQVAAANAKIEQESIDSAERQRSAFLEECDRIYAHIRELRPAAESSKGGVVMNHNEKLLLEKVLDALDRLFDWKSTAIDVWAVLSATGEALRLTPHYPEFEGPTADLEALIKMGCSPEMERVVALKITDNLRNYLAELPLY